MWNKIILLHKYFLTYINFTYLRIEIKRNDHKVILMFNNSIPNRSLVMYFQNLPKFMIIH